MLHQVKKDWRNKLGAKSSSTYWIAGVVSGQVFPGEMQATKQQAVWPRTKKPKLEEEATGDVSPQSAEPTNTAESGSDSDTEWLNSL